MKSQELCVFVLLLVTSACAAAAGGRAPRGLSIPEQPSSPFIKKNNIICEQQYETPAVMLVGTQDKLIRCVYGDLETCETFHDTGSEVISLLVVGEYVYAGTDSKKILRCYLNQVGSCQIYQALDTYAQSLTSANGYLYAGLERGGIFRCTLNVHNSCQPHKNIEDYEAIYALTYIDDYIYAGLWNGTVMRCSQTSSDCALVYTMSMGITGFSNVGNNIIAISLWHGLRNCSRKIDGAIESCASLSLGYNFPIDIASFLGACYTVENREHIHTCEWVNGSVICTPYGTFDRPRSIAFAYAAVHMRGRFANENTSCVWQKRANCPPLVQYYDPVERAQFQIHVKHGLLYNSIGTLVDTTDADEGRAIFAMDRSGRILLSNLHEAGVLHTSSFFAGGPVAGVGELVVKAGVVEQLVSCSEHYRPSLELNAQAVHSLRAQGYARPLRVQPCAADLQ